MFNQIVRGLSWRVCPLDQANAIDTLMCDQRVTIRGIAIDLGLISKSTFIRSKILTEVIFQKQSVVIKFLPENNLTEKTKTWLTKNPGLSIPFTYYDREASCIGLYNNNCLRSYVMDISGETVDLRYSGDFGQFILNEKGVLEGEYFPKNLGASIKAQIRLY